MQPVATMGRLAGTEAASAAPELLGVSLDHARWRAESDSKPGGASLHWP